MGRFPQSKDTRGNFTLIEVEPEIIATCQMDCRRVILV